MPLFSVISPMYNVENYAKQCIESILAQSFEDYELILVDDGGKDNTPQIIDDYAKKDSRIIPIHKENGGLVSARKAGISVAKGEYIVFVDGDDWLHTECLSTFARAIENHPGVDLVTACLFYISPDGAIREQRPLKWLGYLDKAFLEENVYPNFTSFHQSQCAKAFKREIYAEFETRVADCVTIGEDESVVYPMLYSLSSVCVLEDCLYYYRYNPDSITKNRRKEWSTDGLLARVKLFEESLDLSKYNLDEQLVAYVVHATINQCLSYFKANSYKDAKKKTKALLTNELVGKHIAKKVAIPNKKERIAKVGLEYRLYPVIKLYSLLW